MCMDKIFVHMIDTYYATGQATWMNEEQLKKSWTVQNCATASAEASSPTSFCPARSGDMDVFVRYRSQVTAVLIWESTCGHCKKELPKYKELYKEWHPKGLEIYAIGNDFEPEPGKNLSRNRNTLTGST